MNPELSSFATRLREAIQGRDAALRRPVGAARRPYPEWIFDSLALELFALQFQHNTAYRKICEAWGLTSGIVEHWTQIPAVPTAAFKELELSCISPEERDAVFHSSGTTGQEPSRHYHCRESLKVYQASLSTWFLANVLPDLQFTIYDLRLLCLTPPPEQAPHSSLVHMFETVRQNLGAPESIFAGKVDAAGKWVLDSDAALAILADNSKLKTQNPKLILGTAFSFVHLLDFLGEHNLRFQLPPGSRVMETGGYKNRSRSLPKMELHALITERLGVPPENIVCEYGMNELSSQAYAPGAPASSRRVFTGATKRPAGWKPALPVPLHFPPWARVQLISPETGQEVADGETGLIRIYDLANVFSVMAVQTEDLGIRRGDGFELLGRSQFSEPRGCSLMSHSELRIPHSALK